MRRMSLDGQRRLFGFGLLGIAGFTIYWYLFSTGIPVIWGPSASASEMAAGRELYSGRLAGYWAVFAQRTGAWSVLRLCRAGAQTGRP